MPHQPSALDQYRPFLDDEVGLSGVGLEIDEDGNFIGVLDELPELPPLPGAMDGEYEAQLFHEQVLEAGEQLPQHPKQVGGRGAAVKGEQALPDAKAFPSRAGPRQPSSSSSSTLSLETSETERAVAPVKRRGRPKRNKIMFDQKDHISREEFRSWSQNYVANMERLRNRPKLTSVSQAKKNALAFLYGNGIAKVGIPIIGDIGGLTHPLAEDFAGSVLRARLHGRLVDDNEQDSISKRGRRRGHSEAFADN